MADADAPAVAGGRLAARDHVAAGVDQVVARPGVVEPPGGFLDRPALDVARWIEAPVAARPAGIERAAAVAAQLLADREHVPDVGAGRGRVELAAGQPADLAVGAVGAEAGVDVVEVPEDRIDGVGRDVLVAQVEADDRAHDLLDPPGHEGQIPAWSRAACRLCSYASLV